MKYGDYITIRTECVPKGLVPDKTAIILYQRDDGKYVAMQKKTYYRSDYPVLMSNQVFLIQD